MSDAPFPLPQPTADTAPFWEGAARGELCLPRCTACGKLHFYPRAFCPHCGGRELRWDAVAGRGRIATYTVNHRPASPAFAQFVPYAVALVELDEGPRMLARIVESDVTQVRIGARVQARFERAPGSEIHLVHFALEAA